MSKTHTQIDVSPHIFTAASSTIQVMQVPLSAASSDDTQLFNYEVQIKCLLLIDFVLF